MIRLLPGKPSVIVDGEDNDAQAAAGIDRPYFIIEFPDGLLGSALNIGASISESAAALAALRR